MDSMDFYDGLYGGGRNLIFHRKELAVIRRL